MNKTIKSGLLAGLVGLLLTSAYAVSLFKYNLDNKNRITAEQALSVIEDNDPLHNDPLIAPSWWNNSYNIKSSPSAIINSEVQDSFETQSQNESQSRSSDASSKNRSSAGVSRPADSSAPASSISSSSPDGPSSVSPSTLIPDSDQDPNIMGTQKLSQEKMVSRVISLIGDPNKSSAPYKLNCTLWDLAGLYLEVGKNEGVRGDIAFFQACEETGWFRFRGSVSWIQNNFAGIKGGIEPNGFMTYSTPKDGVIAHIQRLKWYAGRDNFYYPSKESGAWKFNIAQKWSDLGGVTSSGMPIWTDLSSYGTDKILSKYNGAWNAAIIQANVTIAKEYRYNP